MTKFGRGPVTRGKILLAAAVLLGLGGCVEEGFQRTDYVSNHPLSVNAEALSLSITLRELGKQGSKLQQERIREYVQEYIDRGMATMVVETVTPGKKSKEARQISYILEKLGMRSHEYQIVPGTLSGPTRDTVIMTFRAARAVVPECGDWSGDSIKGYKMNVHSNFGCSYRRNIGLMVANPLDLSASTTPENQDSRRAVKVHQKYWAGESGNQVKSELPTTGGN